MPEAPSTLSIVAAAFYFLVAIACLYAGNASRIENQKGWHATIWLSLAALFAVLIISRLLNVEDILRTNLRAWLRAEGMNEDRRVLQGFVITGAIGVFAAGGLAAAYWVSRRIAGRRNIAVAIAGGCGLVMLVIIALRTISLHAMDRLLYGPLKLNWIGDLGSSAVILGAAIYYAALIRQTKRRKRP